MVRPDNEKDNSSHLGNDEGSFQKHNERMRMFYLTHPKIEIKESNCIEPERWLIPLPPVDLDEYVQN